MEDMKKTAASNAAPAKTTAVKETVKDTVKDTVKKVEEAAKPAAKAVKSEASKTAAKAKTAAKTVKEEAPKAAAKVKKAAKKTVKTAAAKKVTATVNLQFAGKSYTTEELVAIAKDVWKYDLKQKVSDFKNVELYVKPEENQAYYVINGEFTGSFFI